MKLLVVLATIILTTAAQRPSYAGSGYIGLPDLADRFKEDGDTSSTTQNLGNRLGDGTTPKIPVDARGDVDLVNRLNTWPNETKPFWLLNAAHIESQRNKTQTGNSNRPTTGTNVANPPNINSVGSENRFGSTDFSAEIDDFGNPIRKPNSPARPSVPTSVQPTGNRFAGSLP